MKLIVALLLLLVVACGSASAQDPETPAPDASTPQPNATPLPTYEECITVLAYLVVNHEHGIYEDNPTIGGVQTSPSEIHNTFQQFGGETPQSLVDRFCSNVLDPAVTTQIDGLLNSR